ncbi:MAG: hypothetical protein MUF31_14455 [Akkermansiaceae bacterium]|nr:hypothetical protein [Akkermansiaceae bacterium]
MRYRLSLIIPLILLGLLGLLWSGKEKSTGTQGWVEGGEGLRVAGWSERWERTAGDKVAQSEVIKEAEQERERFLEKMKRDPAAALASTMSFAAHASLPAELKDFFPRPFSGRAELDQEWEVSVDEQGRRACKVRSVMRLEGNKLEVHGAKGGRVPVLRDAPVAGVRLGRHAVLSEWPVVTLSREDRQWLDIAKTGVDPMSGRETGDEHAAMVAGEVVYFESAANREEAGEMLHAAVEKAAENKHGAIDEPFEWLAGDTGGDVGGNQATPYQQNQIDVLFIRVDFSDFPGEPVSKAALETTLASVNTHLSNFSYGQAGITYTVSNSVYRMPQPGATYAVDADNDGIQTDARARAAGDYTLTNYDVIAVFFPNLGGVPGSEITYGGLASIGGANHWINGFNNVGVIAHEFGHNYGLYHANYEHPEQSLAGSYELPGVLEYGDIFDIMGSGNAPEAHFSHLAKNQMQWISDSKVVEATGDGEFVIYRFDHVNAISNPTLAVKVPISGDTNYWIGYRQLYTSSTFNLLNSAYVVGENMGEGRETSLIDMTPESKVSETEDRRDAGLPVGSSYYDAAAGVTIRSLARGGTEPNQWIRVAVEFDSRIRMAQSLVEVDEARGVARISVERYFGFSNEVSVNYTTVAGTATAGSDYLTVSGTLHWGPGDETPREITIPIKPDSTVENRENLTVQLSSVVGGVLDSGASSTTIRLLDPGQRFADFAPPFFNTTVETVAPLADGKVLIGGTISNISGQTISNIARLNADGSLDTTFQTGTGFDAAVRVIRVQSDGKILVGGRFTTYNGTPCKSIVRLNSNGVIDSAFTAANGTGPNNTEVFSIAIESTGRILVGGNFDSFNGTASEGLVRLTSGGSRDAVNALSLPFVTSWATSVRAIHLDPDGKIMVGGGLYISGGANRSGIARLNVNGTRDTTFDPGGGTHVDGSPNVLSPVYSIDRTHDGKYLIGGFFSAFNGTARPGVARLLSTGGLDGAFVPPALNSTVFQVFYQPGGRTLVSGQFSSPISRLGRLGSTGSADPGFGPAGTSSSSTYALVEGADGALFVAGNFFQYEGTTSRPVVKVASGISPYLEWQESNFTSAEVIAGTGADDVDADGDGLSNLAEFAFGTNPRVAQAAGGFGFAEDGVGVVEIGGERYLQVSIDKGSQAAGAWYAAQFGGGLSSWLPATPGPQSNSVYEVVEDSPTRYTVRDKTPMTGTQRRFARIHLLPAE